MKFLIVDDHRSARRVLTDLLSSVEGASFAEADSLAGARAEARAQAFDLAFVDLRLSERDPSNRDGLVLLRELRGTPVVIVTGINDMPEIREAVRAGAFDYVLKDDLCEEVVLKIVDDLRQQRRAEREGPGSPDRPGAGAAPLGLVGSSAAMGRLRDAIRRVAGSQRPALVLGPSGVGKELVAQALHAYGPRPGSTFLAVNCGALPPNLVESMLFGHEKGAFTGAVTKGEGDFAAVGDGTLFLDELAEMPLELQVKLLRAIEARKFRPVGATRDQDFRGRLVAATNANLEERVRQGKFRDDLYFRLDVLSIRVPSLDERREDIPALVAHFAAQESRPLRFTEDAVRALQLAPWPGNVRQLRHLVERAAVFCDDDPISAASLGRLEGFGGPPADDDLFRRVARLVLGTAAENKLKAIERALIAEAVHQAKGNKTEAARLLGVHRKAIERRLSGAGDDDD
ncbi:MAG TPA: sigma-54 dependent transcriptional regulator [Polyangiaceae bacterium]|nr:sigma-54 dependent transcriptional regulator [Polyangiaceae bacterium]